MKKRKEYLLTPSGQFTLILQTEKYIKRKENYRLIFLIVIEISQSWFLCVDPMVFTSSQRARTISSKACWQQIRIFTGLTALNMAQASNGFFVFVF